MNDVLKSIEFLKQFPRKKGDKVIALDSGGFYNPRLIIGKTYTVLSVSATTTKVDLGNNIVFGYYHFRFTTVSNKELL